MANANSLTVTIPPATTTGAYNVQVVTANGTSPSATANAYTYTPVVPTVTGITSVAGNGNTSAAGGTTVTITGTGFLSGAAGDSTTVQFIDQGPGSNVYTAPSSSVVVNSTGTQLTATTPAISTTDLAYSVVVTTAPGGQSSQASAPTFNYSLLLPLVASIYAPHGVTGTSGPPGTSVTVTGVGFITTTGSTTVQLVPTSGNGSTLTLTSTNVSSSTTLTATVPNGGSLNKSYYVVVTTPSGTSGTSGAPQFTWT